MPAAWEIKPDNLRKRFEYFVDLLNSLPGIKADHGHMFSTPSYTDYSCGVYLHMDTTKVGSNILSRCLSGRYYNYFKGEQKADMAWKMELSDTDQHVVFRLYTKRKPKPDGTFPELNRLINNIEDLIKHLNAMCCLYEYPYSDIFDSKVEEGKFASLKREINLLQLLK